MSLEGDPHLPHGVENVSDPHPKPDPMFPDHLHQQQVPHPKTDPMFQELHHHQVAQPKHDPMFQDHHHQQQFGGYPPHGPPHPDQVKNKILMKCIFQLQLSSWFLT
jgi:hypothetical protein